MKSLQFISIFMILILMTAFPGQAQESWSPEHVYYGPGGKLTYIPDSLGNTIPDFSQVGYRYGDEPIPDIPVVVEVEPAEGDDGATIQAAIKSLYGRAPDANGFRGAVLLKKGTYQVTGQIIIAVSGIVLRGEGETDDGTVIIAEGTCDRDLIRVDNGASRSVNSSSRVSIVENYVPLGRKFVKVANASGFTVGDQIVIYRPGTSQWISDLKMDQITATEGVMQWQPSSYSFYFERIITKIRGDTIFFRNPLVMALETKYGGGAVYKYTFNRIQNVGIENLCLKSAYEGRTDENHSWNAVVFESLEHGWVRNVTSWYFAYSCVNVGSKSKHITVENCHYKDPKSLIDGGRRYSFNINGSLCLVKNCTTSHGRHDYVNGHRVTGPNVFTNCSATDAHSDIGPHHRWAMGTLFDAIVSDGPINVQDRDDWGMGHGWAGANTVFWNCRGSSSICQSPWVSAKNYNFGFIGTKSRGAFAGRPDGVWIGHNEPGIFPASLYEAQLDERLNGTSLFMALSSLKQLNDSSFLMQFTLPLVPEQIINSNFAFTGTVEIDSGAFKLTQDSDYSVIITSPRFKTLPNMAEVVVRVNNLTSQDGKLLHGVTSASFILPDRRPVVTGESKFISNINGSVIASSSKPGIIYFVKYGLHLTTRDDLDSLVQINQGRKVEAPTGNSPVTIYAQGLPGGYYEYYAVEETGIVSAPATQWASVTQDGPVTGMDTYELIKRLSVYQHNGLIVVEPGHAESYSLEIIAITGQVICRKSKIAGVHAFRPGNIHGMILVRTKSTSGVQVAKIWVD